MIVKTTISNIDTVLQLQIEKFINKILCVTHLYLHDFFVGTGGCGYGGSNGCGYDSSGGCGSDSSNGWGCGCDGTDDCGYDCVGVCVFPLYSIRLQKFSLS